MAGTASIPEFGGVQRVPRALEFALFVTAMIWAVASKMVAVRAAAGIAGRYGLLLQQTLLESVFLLFLVLIGFQALDWIAARGVLPGHAAGVEVLPLPRRKTWPREWLTGAAVGWGLALATVLVPLLALRFHAAMNHGPLLLWAVANATLTLLVSALASEAIFRGYAYQRLIRAIGPGWATLAMSVVFAVVLVGAQPGGNLFFALVNATLLGVLLALSYLRTHALWLSWGLHFGYRAVTAVLLGLPVAGRNDYASLTNGYLRGPRWFSGGEFGPDAACFTGLLLLGAIAVLYRISRDWAWAYTLPEIVPGGYEVTVAPPAAHVAMEKAAAPPPLVQIGPVAPVPPPPKPDTIVYDRD